MTLTNSQFARRLWAVRQALFPSFERKTYHLQFRHAVLITMMLMCASFTLPAYHQTLDYSDSYYFGSPDIPVESSYDLVHRHVRGIMFFNVGVAFFIGFHLAIEPLFHRGVPVWYELTWMTCITIAEVICLGLMASSRPAVCDFHFGVDPSIPMNGKFSPMNSATSICSNWHGMIGMLATMIVMFLLHITWHVVVSVRHLRTHKGVFTYPIADYRWNLREPRTRVNVVFPADVEASAPNSKDKHVESTGYSTTDYTFKTSLQSDTLNFPSIHAVDEFSNYARPSAPAAGKLNLQSLPVNAKPVVLEQSIISRSDASSIIEGEKAGSPKDAAPFSYASRS